MNRAEFLKAMTKSLKDTVKESMAPIMEEKASELELTAKVILNQKWYEVDLVEKPKELEIKDFYFAGNPVFTVYQQGEWKAYKKTCDKCHSILHINLFEKKCSCFACDLHTKLADHTGQLVLTELDLINQNNKWYVGLPS